MAKFEFNNDRDANMRIGHSIVMHKDVPVWVADASRKACQVTDLETGQPTMVLTEELDLTPVVIGNVQIGKSYVHAQRTPVRRWKQGLNRENLNYCDMPWKKPRVNLCSGDVKKAILNQYHTVLEALEMVLGGTHTAVAFSTRWGIGIHNEVPHLIYKDDPVGVASEGELVLFAPKFYLKESLLEALNGRP